MDPILQGREHEIARGWTYAIERNKRGEWRAVIRTATRTVLCASKWMEIRDHVVSWAEQIDPEVAGHR